MFMYVYMYMYIFYNLTYMFLRRVSHLPFLPLSLFPFCRLFGLGTI